MLRRKSPSQFFVQDLIGIIFAMIPILFAGCKFQHEPHNFLRQLSPRSRFSLLIMPNSNALSRVKDVKMPLLIMHGERDVRAPFRQFELAVKILSRKARRLKASLTPASPMDSATHEIESTCINASKLGSKSI